MNQRHPNNSNLILHRDSHFNGYPVNTGHGPLIQNYLAITAQTIHNAIDAHPRTFVIGLCLRIPSGLTIVPDNAISRFFASLKAQIKHDRERASQIRERAHKTGVRYIWARERVSSKYDHYHVWLFLNGHAYAHIGDIQEDDKNMAARIVKAWATALRLYPDDVRDSVEINACKEYKEENIHDLFYWASYACKASTKHYRGDSGRSFGCSRG